MTNRLAIGAARLASRLASHASEAVTLSDGGYSTDGLTATVTQGRRQAIDSNGMVIEWESTDFIVTAASLILNGKLITEPKRGMRFSRMAGAVQEVFEVQAPSGEQPFHWSDAAHTIMRIHTVQMS
jgi:hypothetical protein